MPKKIKNLLVNGMIIDLHIIFDHNVNVTLLLINRFLKQTMAFGPDTRIVIIISNYIDIL